MDIDLSNLEFKETEPGAPGTYVGEDGLLRCGKCHGAKQVRLEWLGTTKTLPCICRCESEEHERQQAAARREAMRRRRASGAPENIELPGWRADLSGLCTTAPPYDKLTKYAERFPKMKASRVGLLLFGPPSCGKSYGASYLASKVEEAGHRVLVTAPTRILNELQDLRAKNRNNLIDSIARFDLIVLDDLGSERITDFTREQMFTLIDSIYRSQAALVVTTNLSLKEMKAPDSMSSQRIYERLLERCRPLAFPERNWRTEIAAAAQAQARLLFE
ncbi:ATP-binding protein [Adlercreutzia sp. ZJ473]|uniref:ATP-binding protein n=1 Tax=Adlercreutzia sp. ZJ473 TaxID=2722822 RepID=UPI001555E335|nr:ATP-binding protein [Adlercreutzia sp. ZJ473]